MSERRLQVFHTVAELQSFTRAGERLHMTQPAVTFQIRQLEEQFNTRLFDREHNKISLTEAGRVVYDYADRILQLHAELDASIRKLTDNLSGLLRLGASTTIAEYVLPSVLVDFKNAFPEVVIRLLVSNTDGIVQMVGDGRVDLGMVEGPVHNRALTSKLYHMDELVVVLPPDHPLSRRRSVAPRDLAKFPFITREEGSGTREVIESYLAANAGGFEALDVVMELGSPEAIKGAVAAGLGISILSRATLSKELALDALRALSLKPSIERPLSFVYADQKFRRPAADQLLEFTLATER